MTMIMISPMMIRESVDTLLDSDVSIIIPPPWIWWFIIVFVVVVLFVVRIIFMAVVIYSRRRRCRQRRPHPSSTTTRQQQQQRREGTIRTLVVLGSGGHTTEMLQLLKSLETEQPRYTPLLFVMASTDDTSEQRIQALLEVGGKKKDDDDDEEDDDPSPSPPTTTTRRILQPDKIYKIPRSREVGQSYWTSIFTTLYSFPYAFYIVGQIRPHLLLCNGPGTCLPIAIATLMYRILGIVEGNIVFVESFCRVSSLSLTGKILYPLADMFVVHWDELHQRYPWSQTVSTFVPPLNKSKAE